jgi:hypothetical protein
MNYALKRGIKRKWRNLRNEELQRFQYLLFYGEKIKETEMDGTRSMHDDHKQCFYYMCLKI